MISMLYVSLAGGVWIGSVDVVHLYFPCMIDCNLPLSLEILPAAQYLQHENSTFLR